MILVTGATGLVGSHIVLALLRAGEDVRALKRPDSITIAIDQLLKYHNVQDLQLSYAEGDVNDPISIKKALEGCQRVFHCAAMVSFDRASEKLLFQVNVTGTANVVNACLRENVPLTYISSTAAIGDVRIEGLLTEESVWTTDSGRSPYSLSKRYAELEVFRGIQEGLDATIVNPGVVIGPGNWGQSSTTLFLSGQKGMRFYPSGGNGFVDARDVAEISLALSSQKTNGRHLLIGENLNFKNVFSMAAKQFNAKQPRLEVPKWLIVFVIGWLKFLE
ncbi:MAG: NAD-dependent epimerase/dehydratase family protein, partial [Salibacteraceae bacterium]